MSNGERDKAIVLGMEAVPLDQDVEDSHSESKFRFKKVPDFVTRAFEVTNISEHRKNSFDNHTDIPFPAATNAQSGGMPILNMIEETAKYIKLHYPESTKVGLLATTGTIETQLYQKALQKFQLTSVVPSIQEQHELVMRAIYGHDGIKAGVLEGNAVSLLKKAANRLIDQGGTVIIGGCTEIPLILNKENLSVPFVNPTEIIAQKAIKFAFSPNNASSLSDSDASPVQKRTFWTSLAHLDIGWCRDPRIYHRQPVIS